MRLLTAASAIALALSSASAQQPEPETRIFGIEPGKPVPYPRCGNRPYKEICATTYNPDEKPWADYYVNYPDDQRPDLVASTGITLKVADGNVVAFRFQTLGVQSQELDLKTLSEKFGKPISVVRLPMKTLSGGSFEAMEAKWLYKGMAVIFDSTAFGFKGGKVEIFTPAGAVIQRGLDDAEQAKRVAL